MISLNVRLGQTENNIYVVVNTNSLSGLQS